MIPGGYGDALHSIANADYPIWSVQLQMTCPLGRSADRAAYERARLELQHNRVQIRRIELRIASEVINAALRIESIRERIEAATASWELADEQLQAEESKFEVGLSTDFFVLQTGNRRRVAGRRSGAPLRPGRRRRGCESKEDPVREPGRGTVIFALG